MNTFLSGLALFLVTTATAHAFKGPILLQCGFKGPFYNGTVQMPSTPADFQCRYDQNFHRSFPVVNYPLVVEFEGNRFESFMEYEYCPIAEGDVYVRNQNNFSAIVTIRKMADGSMMPTQISADQTHCGIALVQ